METSVSWTARRRPSTPFDAIEFSADLTVIDVLYDIAFTVMDLSARGQGALANRLLNRYYALSLDYGGAAHMPIFLAMRAAVRAMTQAILARDLPGKEAAQADARSLRFLRAAAGFFPDRDPMLIAIGGLSGSGKSSLARRLAPGLGPPPGAILIHSDALRKGLHGKRPEDRLPPSAYYPEADERLYRALACYAARALRAGVPVIVDATFRGAAHRAAIEAVASTRGVRFQGFWLDVPPDELRRRVAGRSGGMSDADLSVLERQLEGQRAMKLEGAWTTIDAEGPIEEIAARVVAVIGSRASEGDEGGSPGDGGLARN